MNDFENKRKALIEKLRKMKKRCYSKSDKCFKWYGEKGIFICDEWLSDKEKFVDWAINNGYELGLTIERINTDKGYQPDNCRFIPMSEQPLNTDRNVFILYNDEVLIISEVARRENVSCEAIRKRVKHGRYKIMPNPNKKVESKDNTVG